MSYCTTVSLSPDQRPFVGRLIGKGGLNLKETCLRAKGTSSNARAPSIKWITSSSEFQISGGVAACNRAAADLNQQIYDMADNANHIRQPARTFYVQETNHVIQTVDPKTSRRNRFDALLDGVRLAEDVVEEKRQLKVMREDESKKVEAKTEAVRSPKPTTMDEWEARKMKERESLNGKFSVQPARKIESGGIVLSNKSHGYSEDVLWPEIRRSTKTTKKKTSGRNPTRIIVVDAPGQSTFVQESRNRHRTACTAAGKAWEENQKLRAETPEKDQEEVAARREAEKQYLFFRGAYLKAHPEDSTPKKMHIEQWASRMGITYGMSVSDEKNVADYLDSVLAHHTHGGVTMIPYSAPSA